MKVGVRAFSQCATICLGLWSTVSATEPTEINTVNIIESSRLNAAGLTRYDVLAEITLFDDMEELGYRSSTSRYRIICDKDHESYVQYVNVTDDRVGVSKDKPTSEKLSTLNASLVRGSELQKRHWPEPIRLSKSESFANAMLDCDGLNLTFIGVFMFPTSATLFAQFPGDRIEASSKLWISAKAEVAAPVKSRRIGPNEIEFTFANTPSAQRPSPSGFELVCDLTSLLPTKRCYWGTKDGERINLSTEVYHWKEAGDVYVPDEVVLTRRRTMRTENGKVIVFASRQVSKFHWFSVNQEIEEGRFDSKWIDDPQDARRFTDPNAAGATSLLE